MMLQPERWRRCGIVGTVIEDALWGITKKDEEEERRDLGDTLTYVSLEGKSKWAMWAGKCQQAKT